MIKPGTLQYVHPGRYARVLATSRERAATIKRMREKHQALLDKIARQQKTINRQGELLKHLTP